MRMNKGKKVELFCNTHNFNNFIYGKKYIGTISKGGGYLQYLDENNVFSTPSIEGYNGKEKVKYFLTIEEWRENRLSCLLD